MTSLHQLTGAPPDRVLIAIEFAGYFGFTLAHFLHAHGYPVVSVLPAHTKRFKDVVHGQPLKSDPKDAQTVAELARQGFSVAFPFLAPPYARLRYLVSGRERLSLQRRSLINRIRSLLQVVWPEFEQIFPQLTKRTPFELLAAFPGPHALLAAPRGKVEDVLWHASRGHHGDVTMAQLRSTAQHTLGLPGAQATLALELELLLEQYRLYQRQIHRLEAAMVEALRPLPEAHCLQTIPLVAPVTAAVFLGSIGDPRAYHSAHEILRVAGLSLVTRQSGLLKGRTRVSKRGRPVLRQHAYMFAVRSIRVGGLFRAEYERLLANGKQTTKKKAVVAVSRSGSSSSGASPATSGCSPPSHPTDGGSRCPREAGAPWAGIGTPGLHQCARRSSGSRPLQNGPRSPASAPVSDSGVSTGALTFERPASKVGKDASYAEARRGQVLFDNCVTLGQGPNKRPTIRSVRLQTRPHPTPGADPIIRSTVPRPN